MHLSHKQVYFLPKIRLYCFLLYCFTCIYSNDHFYHCYCMALIELSDDSAGSHDNLEDCKYSELPYITSYMRTFFIYERCRFLWACTRFGCQRHGLCFFAYDNPAKKYSSTHVRQCTRFVDGLSAVWRKVIIWPSSDILNSTITTPVPPFNSMV